MRASGDEAVVHGLRHSPEFRRVLTEERARNSRHAAASRLVALLGLLAASLVFRVRYPAFVGAPMWLMLPYTVGGLALWLYRRHVARGAAYDGWLVAAVDMPMATLLIVATVRQLADAGQSTNATPVLFFAPVYFAMLLGFAGLSLDMRQIVAAAVVGIGLQSWLLYTQRPAETFMISQGVLMLAVAFGATAYARNRTVRLAAAFADAQLRRERLVRYFSPQVVTHLEARGGAPASVDVAEITVLFADLRDFTALASRLDAAEVVATLNEFHACMVDCIFRYGGTLDKFIGDGLMAYFGAPIADADHAMHGVSCALDMHAALETLNGVRAARGAAPLRMGVGVHTGPAVLGDIGAPHRKEFTAVGDTVNVAARVEQLTKIVGTPILVSEETRRRVPAVIAFEAAQPMPVKGKAAPLSTFVPTRVGGRAPATA